MKLDELIKPITIETDSGDATLYPDLSMRLENSGYVRYLTPAQVAEVWAGKKWINWSSDQYDELKAEMGDEELDEFLKHNPYYASWDGEYWSFDEEQHQIPSRKWFEDERNRT